jgi:hypothetical protein
MHVDRSRFLLLTAALATAACGRETPESKSDKDKVEAKEPKAGEAPKPADVKAPASEAAAKTSPPSPPPPPGDSAGAPEPDDENPPPSPVVESTANWD